MSEGAAAARPFRIPWAGLILMTAVGAAVYVVVAAFVNADRLRDAVVALRPGGVIAAAAVAILAYAVRTARWDYLLRRLGSDVHRGVGVLIFLSSFALTITPGKMGELVKIYQLRRRSTGGYSTSLAAVVTERLQDATAMGLLFAVGVLLTPASLVPRAFALLGLVPLAVAGVLLIPRLIRPAVRWVQRFRPKGDLAGRILVFHDKVRRLLRLGPFVFTGLLSLLAWGLEVSALWFLSDAMDVRLSFAACALIFSASVLGGILTFIPGGLGATEGSMIALMQLFGVALAPAAALTLLVRALTLWLGVLIGFVATLILESRPVAAGAPNGVEAAGARVVDASPATR